MGSDGPVRRRARGGRPLLIESRSGTPPSAAADTCAGTSNSNGTSEEAISALPADLPRLPFKSMGASLWRAQGRPESVIANECARRSDAWDAIVVPESFCVDLYRREYRFSAAAPATRGRTTLLTADGRSPSAGARAAWH